MVCGGSRKFSLNEREVSLECVGLKGKMYRTNGHHMRRKAVAGSSKTSKYYLMQQHRDSERDRHRELNQGISDIVRRVPGHKMFAKHSKIVRLQRVIDYITHLEKNIEAVYRQMNLKYDFRHVFMSANFASSTAPSYLAGSKQQFALSRGSRSSVRTSSRRYRHPHAEVKLTACDGSSSSTADEAVQHVTDEDAAAAAAADDDDANAGVKTEQLKLLRQCVKRADDSATPHHHRHTESLSSQPPSASSSSSAASASGAAMSSSVCDGDNESGKTCKLWIVVTRQSSQSLVTPAAWRSTKDHSAASEK